MAEVTAARPLVSVVTVCFDSERHIAEAMGSVLAQTYPAIEYIVVDGGSRDGTLDIVRSFEQPFEGRLAWTSGPDNGIYDAMNKGISRARGELVGLLNSDDAYLPDAIERLVDAWIADSDADGVYGDVEIMDEGGRTLRTERAREAPPFTRPEEMPMCHQSLLVSRRTYLRYGTYDVDYRLLADYEFMLRVLAAGGRFLRIEGPVSRFRLGGACNGDTRSMNEERERIRIAYGASRLRERVRRTRHSVNMVVWDMLQRLKGVRR